MPRQNEPRIARIYADAKGCCIRAIREIGCLFVVLHAAQWLPKSRFAACFVFRHADGEAMKWPGVVRCADELYRQMLGAVLAEARRVRPLTPGTRPCYDV